MRAPDFWYEKPGIAAGLLAPVGAALDAAGRLRRAVANPYHAPVPVICVGNLVAGGSGKTPVALSLAEILATRGAKVAIVMRGYGGKLAGPLRVDPEHHDAEAVGDEALLAGAQTMCWVARDRVAGVRAAVADGAEAIILDDGFQNPHVAKDLSLVVVDAASGFGNCRLIPAGPLRERVAAGLARADAVLLVGKEEEPRVSEAESRAPAPTHLPLTRQVSLPRGHGGGVGHERYRFYASASTRSMVSAFPAPKFSRLPASADPRNSSPACAHWAPISSVSAASPTITPIARRNSPRYAATPPAPARGWSRRARIGRGYRLASASVSRCLMSPCAGTTPPRAMR